MKETRLNEAADIYRQRNKLTEKQKMSEMTTKQKITYFNDYYRNKLIAGFLLGGLVIYLLITIFSPKDDTVFYAAIVNDVLDAEKLTTMQNDFASYLEMDSKKEQIMLDNSFYLSNDGSMDSNTMASEQRFVTYLSATQIDVIITDETRFKKYVDMGYMESLSDRLPTDLYSDLSDSFYIASTEDDTTEKAYGIYLEESTAYKDLGSVIQKPVIGIVLNSKYKDNSVEFIKYLFDMPY